MAESGSTTAVFLLLLLLPLPLVHCFSVCLPSFSLELGRLFQDCRREREKERQIVHFVRVHFFFYLPNWQRQQQCVCVYEAASSNSVNQNLMCCVEHHQQLANYWASCTVRDKSDLPFFFCSSSSFLSLCPSFWFIHSQN